MFADEEEMKWSDLRVNKAEEMGGTKIRGGEGREGMMRTCMIVSGAVGIKESLFASHAISAFI